MDFGGTDGDVSDLAKGEWLGLDGEHGDSLLAAVDYALAKPKKADEADAYRHSDGGWTVDFWLRLGCPQEERSGRQTDRTLD